MPQLSRRAILRLPLAGLVPPLGSPSPVVAVPRSRGEVRGLWVTRSWMTSSARVAQVIGDAERHGFTAVFVQVRGRGDAFYAGGPDPRAALLARQPSGFDPLAELIARARPAGLEVHAWLNVNLVAGSTAIATAPQHVLVQHPEWLMVPRPLAEQVLPLSPRSPAYVAAVASWSQRHAAQIEGLFSSPIPEGAQLRLIDVVAHLTAAYRLDGLHLDYIRYPSPDFDCSRAALDAFRDAIVNDLTPGELAALDQRARRAPLAFIDYFPARWTSFRKERLTRLVGRLAATARQARPEIRMSAAVWPDHDDAVRRKFQDWPAWLRSGVIEAVCPMLYTSSAATYGGQLRQLAAHPRGTVWPGIGAFKIEPDEAARRVDAARALGFSGVMLYSYDSMTGGAGRPSPYLGTLQRRAFRASSTASAGAAR
ncbi:MAG: glycoside hydrolase family 10 protein [Luteitalea sp.]